MNAMRIHKTNFLYNTDMIIVAEKCVVKARNVIKQGRTDIRSLVTCNNKVRLCNAFFSCYFIYEVWNFNSGNYLFI